MLGQVSEKVGEEAGEDGQEDEEDLGAEADAEAEAHVGGGDGTVVGADVGFVEIFAEVVVGTAEAAVQDGGEGGLGPSAVGRGVLGSVVEDEAEACGEAGDPVHEGHAQGGEAGGDVVGHVVDAGGPAAEAQVAVGVVADHGVEGVDHLVGHHAGDAEEGVPEEGGDDAVAEVLGKGLEGGDAAFLTGEAAGVATYDAGYLAAGVFLAAVGCLEDHADFPAEGLAGQAEEDAEGGEEDVEGGQERTLAQGQQEVEEDPGEAEDEGDAGEGEQGAFRHAPMAVVEALLPETDPATHVDDGMGKAFGVAEEEVEKPAEGEFYVHCSCLSNRLTA